MKKYVKLLRVNHYIKNILILLPIIFSNKLFNGNLLVKVILGIFSFSLIASAVYIFNDLQDIKNDKLHPLKSKRPLTSGEIKISTAVFIDIVLIVLGFLINWIIKGSILSYIYLLTYLLINLFYSLYLKNYPLIDLAVLVVGYVLRIMYGAEIVDVSVSDWLFLTIVSISFYFVLGKRRNEYINCNKIETRPVLKFYSKDFLDKSMYMFLAISNVFYALWATESDTVELAKNGELMRLTVPIIMLISLKYNLSLEKSETGDPVEIILKDKVLIVLGALYGLFIIGILYF